MFITMPRSLLALKDRYGKSKFDEFSSEEQDVDVDVDVEGKHSVPSHTYTNSRITFKTNSATD